MVPRDTVYKIDGVAIPVPDAEVTLSYADLDSAAAGRDESGYMHRAVLRHRVRTWGFTYTILSAEAVRTLEELLAGKAVFDFESEDGVCKAYCAKQEVRLYDRTRGVYKGMKFNIIEC